MFLAHIFFKHFYKNVSTIINKNFFPYLLHQKIFSALCSLFLAQHFFNYTKNFFCSQNRSPVLCFSVTSHYFFSFTLYTQIFLPTTYKTIFHSHPDKHFFCSFDIFLIYSSPPPLFFLSENPVGFCLPLVLTLPAFFLCSMVVEKILFRSDHSPLELPLAARRAEAARASRAARGNPSGLCSQDTFLCNCFVWCGLAPVSLPAVSLPVDSDHF